jgi:MFS family permease
MPYLGSIDLSRAASSQVASSVPVISICGRLGFGWLGDRLDKRHLTAICFFLTSGGLVFFGCAADGRTWLLVPFLVLFGIGWGGGVPIRVALLRKYFGRKSFGTIYGFTMGIVMLGNLAGPPIAGWVFDRCGTYQGMWFALAGLAVFSVLLTAMIPSISGAIPLASKAKV